jgi:hypothetical protein
MYLLLTRWLQRQVGPAAPQQVLLQEGGRQVERSSSMHRRFLPRSLWVGPRLWLRCCRQMCSRWHLLLSHLLLVRPLQQVQQQQQGELAAGHRGQQLLLQDRLAGTITWQVLAAVVG